MQEYKRIDVNKLVVNCRLFFEFHYFTYLWWEVISSFYLEWLDLDVFFGSQLVDKVGACLLYTSPLAYGREDFRANDFYNQLADWELAYVVQTDKARTPVTRGDELVITRRLFDKYLKLSREYYTDFSGVEEIKEERTYENVGEE